MGEAVLRIRTEGGADVARMLADVERLTAASTRRVRSRQDGEHAHYRQSARTTADEVQRSDQLVTRNRLRQLALTDDARRRSETLYLMMLNRATLALEVEHGKRGRLTEKEKRQVHELAQAMLVEHERAEAAKTAATRREAGRREQLARAEAREAGRRVSRGVEAVGGAAVSMGRELHSAAQDARERRAGTQHTLNAAFYQAGVSGAEAQAMRTTLDSEVTAGSLRGMRSEDVANALMAAQTQFSVLSGSNAGDRMRNLQRQVELMSFARNTFQDPGEVLRVAGMLGQQGIRGADQRSTLMSLTGMAQAGSIELSTLTSAALGPLMQNIARSVSSTMSPAERTSAVRRAVTETMAVGEIGAAAGLTPRDALNALAKTRGSVTSDLTQGRLYDRLRDAHRGDLADQLFQTGPGGRHTLKNADALSLMSSLVQGFGGNANAVSNLLSAGGPGSPMVLDAQQRRLIMALASQSANGQTIAQRVEGMVAQGTGFDEGRVREGQALVDSEEQTRLNAAREQRDSALTDNTSALVRLSNSLHDLMTANPVAGAGVNAVTGLAGSAAGTLLSGGAGRLATRGAAGLAGAGAGGSALAIAGSLVGGLAIGEGINRLIYSDRERAQGDTSILEAETWRNFATAIGQSVRDAFESSPPTVTVDQHTAAHLATVGHSMRGAMP